MVDGSAPSVLTHLPPGSSAQPLVPLLFGPRITFILAESAWLPLIKNEGSLLWTSTPEKVQFNWQTRQVDFLIRSFFNSVFALQNSPARLKSYQSCSPNTSASSQHSCKIPKHVPFHLWWECSTKHSHKVNHRFKSKKCPNSLMLFHQHTLWSHSITHEKVKDWSWERWMGYYCTVTPLSLVALLLLDFPWWDRGVYDTGGWVTQSRNTNESPAPPLETCWRNIPIINRCWECKGELCHSIAFNN